VRVLSLAERSQYLVGSCFSVRPSGTNHERSMQNIGYLISHYHHFLNISSGKLFDDVEDGRNMAERRSSASEMGNCEIQNCTKPAERSVSSENAKSAGLKYAEGLKRVHLCKEHYRQFKKETKKDRVIESLGR
jgi:hypothetical protein